MLDVGTYTFSVVTVPAYWGERDNGEFSLPDHDAERVSVWAAWGSARSASRRD